MLYKYIGKDGSLGYVKNSIYELIVYTSKKGRIVIESRLGFCPYQSKEKFLENWKEL